MNVRAIIEVTASIVFCEEENKKSLGRKDRNEVICCNILGSTSLSLCLIKAIRLGEATIICVQLVSGKNYCTFSTCQTSRLSNKSARFNWQTQCLFKLETSAITKFEWLLSYDIKSKINFCNSLSSCTRNSQFLQHFIQVQWNKHVKHMTKTCQ